MSDRNDEQRQDIYDTFYDRVNMQPKELEDWLETDDSKNAGGNDSGESTGHKSGRRIIEIKRTNKDDLTESDYDHMNEVNNYISRHLSQRPEDKSDDELKEMTWTHSLKNWGHDPLKD